jgi:hypothetical protein
MRPSFEAQPKHEEPEHWRRKAVELRRRAMATTDSALAARLHANADACALVGSELAGLPAGAPGKSPWPRLRSSFAAPVAIASLLLLAWTAQVVVPSASLVELTAASRPNADGAADRQVKQHQEKSPAEAGTTVAAVSAQNEVASAPLIPAPENVGHEAALASAGVKNAGTPDVTARPGSSNEVDERPPYKPLPPPSGAKAPARAAASPHRAETRLASARSGEDELSGTAGLRRSGLQATASQREEDCRTYVADDPLQRGHLVYGVACRQPNGRWKLHPGRPR